ncbi:diacylglycerol kinase [Uruburuella testudinis]|uniref:Diacylglycerol kinase n=1 Tax=Uruburuella testudinis TaxID=1282863 RepID=A0ABY4DRD4_9NEIS|nr:diacylglycerol kinase [Uruburuella testudinis]UOO80953.1 diacylglycerol kinase [Uruburuella testudinis]
MVLKPDSYARRMKGQQGLRRIINALRYSADGVRFACEEQGFRQLLWLHGALMLMLCFAGFATAVKMILVLGSFASIVIELLNTGIEAAVDHTSQDQHELAKKAKDVGSAAQYITLAMLAVLWLMAFTGD